MGDGLTPASAGSLRCDASWSSHGASSGPARQRAARKALGAWCGETTALTAYGNVARAIAKEMDLPQAKRPVHQGDCRDDSPSMSQGDQGHVWATAVPEAAHRHLPEEVRRRRGEIDNYGLPTLAQTNPLWSKSSASAPNLAVHASLSIQALEERVGRGWRTRIPKYVRHGRDVLVQYIEASGHDEDYRLDARTRALKKCKILEPLPSLRIRDDRRSSEGDLKDSQDYLAQRNRLTTGKVKEFLRQKGWIPDPESSDGQAVRDCRFDSRFTPAAQWDVTHTRLSITKAAMRPRPSNKNTRFLPVPVSVPVSVPVPEDGLSDEEDEELPLANRRRRRANTEDPGWDVAAIRRDGHIAPIGVPQKVGRSASDRVAAQTAVFIPKKGAQGVMSPAAELPQANTPEDALVRLLYTLQGKYGCLRSSFKALDANADGLLSFEDLKIGLVYAGVSWPKISATVNVRSVFALVDPANIGAISFEDLMQASPPEMQKQEAAPADSELWQFLTTPEKWARWCELTDADASWKDGDGSPKDRSAPWQCDAEDLSTFKNDLLKKQTHDKEEFKKYLAQGCHKTREGLRVCAKHLREDVFQESAQTIRQRALEDVDSNCRRIQKVLGQCSKTRRDVARMVESLQAIAQPQQTASGRRRSRTEYD
eukprot:TRINITY_DN23575_c0_g1_i1.p1 TRINITY_DN23575_c0_g1~~TRINITY_DN23575_c0_g1_i1.p1  ORF type:complete len:652 (-),score=111.80 TRINITY_DN23575_c0_g1_i1:187-2142(-)